jgi:hypothetical protein
MKNFHSIWQQTSRKSLIFAILAAVILCNSAYDNYKILSLKSEQQQASLSKINRWKAEYEMLKPFQTEWNKTLIPTSDITDLYHVFNALDLERYGLSTNQERLNVEKIAQITPEGVPIHANRVCLKTAGDTGLAVTAPRFSPDLLNGLAKLADRRDVEIQNIQLAIENGMPKAVMDFCLVFRT